MHLGSRHGLCRTPNLDPPADTSMPHHRLAEIHQNLSPRERERERDKYKLKRNSSEFHTNHAYLSPGPCPGSLYCTPQPVRYPIPDIIMSWTFWLLYLSSEEHVSYLPHVQTCQPKTFSITFLQPKDRGGDGCSSHMDGTTHTPLPHAKLSY